MNKYFKSLIYTFGMIIIFSLIITLLNYIGLVTGTTLKVLKLIIPIISVFVGGIIMGKNSIKKGWLNGLKIGIVTTLLLLLITIISKTEISFKTFIYYLILLADIMFGSMVGISKTSSNK